MQKIIYLIIILIIVSGCSSTRYKVIKNERNNHLEENSLRNDRNLNQLDHFIGEWIGIPYKYGGMSNSGVDCSGFSSLVYIHVYNKTIPRTAHDQFIHGIKSRRESLQKGDLVFFRLSGGRDIDHVGIYLGDNQFVHATKSAGVTISNLSDDIYMDYFVGSCRY